MPGSVRMARWSADGCGLVASAGSMAAACRVAVLNAWSLAMSATTTASGIRKAMATIEVTAALTSASVRRIEPAAAPCLRGVIEEHADSAHGPQVPRLRGGLAELAAQPRHVHIDGLIVAVGLMPDLGEQLTPGHDLARPGGQEGQQVEFAARQGQDDSVQAGRAARDLHLQAADPQHGRAIGSHG